jgi:hypothetical protein
MYQNTIDHSIEMYDKLVNKVYNKAQGAVDANLQSRKKELQKTLAAYKTLGLIILDESIPESELRYTLLQSVSKENLADQITSIEAWLSGKYSHVFHSVVNRHSYVRQFLPRFLEHLNFTSENTEGAGVIAAIQLLSTLNHNNKRTLPDDASVEFMPKKVQQLVAAASDSKTKKHAWECAVMIAIRDEIKSGNIAVENSKGFGKLDSFFIPDSQWAALRSDFFKRAALPEKAQDVPKYLTQRLNQAYDNFLNAYSWNQYVTIDQKGWHLSSDEAEEIEPKVQAQLHQLNSELNKKLRTIKLPDLLIEVDNELKFTDCFLASVERQSQIRRESVCAILATIMAHGCNIGPATMAELVEGITYKQIKHVTDWQMTEDVQRSAIKILANAIYHLDITKKWGDGTTSSSDGQRFSLKRKVLQQTYSHKFRDLALEFYSFMANRPKSSEAVTSRNRIELNACK